MELNEIAAEVEKCFIRIYSLYEKYIKKIIAIDNNK